MAQHKAKQYNEDVNRQLKSSLNRSFSDVAIQPVPDVAPPAPVMQNVGMTLMLGAAQAIGAGIEGNQTKNYATKKAYNNFFSMPDSPWGSTNFTPNFSHGNPYTTNYQSSIPISKTFQAFTP
jgi:hypothetical protein